MNTEIEHLSKNISPNTAGIIWLTDSYLDFKSPGVYEFNYLLDGILLEQIALNKEMDHNEKKVNFFLGNSFGSPLFVSHTVIESKDDLESMYKGLTTASPIIKEGAHIHIFNKSKNTANINVLKELSQRYKEYKFLNLNI